MLHFFFLAHGALGWADDILLAVVLAAILSYGLGIWYAARRTGSSDHMQAQKEPEHLSLD